MLYQLQDIYSKIRTKFWRMRKIANMPESGAVPAFNTRPPHNTINGIHIIDRNILRIISLWEITQDFPITAENPNVDADRQNPLASPCSLLYSVNREHRSASTSPMLPSTVRISNDSATHSKQES